MSSKVSWLKGASSSASSGISASVSCLNPILFTEYHRRWKNYTCANRDCPSQKYNKTHSRFSVSFVVSRMIASNRAALTHWTGEPVGLFSRCDNFAELFGLDDFAVTIKEAMLNPKLPTC